MKVIGESGNNKYICEIDFYELEKFLNLYYGKMSRMKVGDEIDLSKGYDFYVKTMSALQKTDELIKANKEVIDVIFTGIHVSANANNQQNNQQNDDDKSSQNDPFPR